RLGGSAARRLGGSAARRLIIVGALSPVVKPRFGDVPETVSRSVVAAAAVDALRNNPIMAPSNPFEGGSRMARRERMLETTCQLSAVCDV
ncbi:MAG: hypothetical protein OXG03_05770, partial [Gammaproteobacteria bacterium]|nr:hypothetical protein [Gammaproteobacteria bacterium]